MRGFFIAAVCALLTVAACTSGTSRTDRPAPRVDTTADRRPNFVVIVLDDATYREMPLMPKLQSLVARHGTTFPNYFDSTPICCPPRAGILSGQYNTNNGVRDNFSAGRFAHDNQVASWLHDAGYETALLGKYLNEFPCVDGVHIPRGWDQWQQVCDANRSQYDYILSDNGLKVQYGSEPKDYMVDVLRRHMVRTIDTFSRTGKPFFLYVTPTVPHNPLQVPPRYAKTPVPTYPAPAAFDEADMSDKVWLRDQKPLGVSWDDYFARAEVPRLRMNLAVDDMVGAAIRTLHRRGELDNTVVMVLNDNGFMRGEHRLAFGKGLPYYESVNSGPLYIRGPGFPAGTTNPALVANIDLAPTMVHLAGARARRVMDGVNFMPAVAQPDLFADRVLFHYLPQWGVVTGLRVGDRYAYFKFHHGCCYAELYNYRDDPQHSELTNVASDPREALVMLAFGDLTDRLAKCHGRACALTFDERGRVGRLAASTAPAAASHRSP